MNIKLNLADKGKHMWPDNSPVRKRKSVHNGVAPIKINYYTEDKIWHSPGKKKKWNLNKKHLNISTKRTTWAMTHSKDVQYVGPKAVCPQATEMALGTVSDTTTEPNSYKSTYSKWIEMFEHKIFYFLGK